MRQCGILHRKDDISILSDAIKSKEGIVWRDIHIIRVELTHLWNDRLRRRKDIRGGGGTRVIRGIDGVGWEERGVEGSDLVG